MIPGKVLANKMNARKISASQLRNLFRVGMLAILATLSSLACAHEMTIAEMELRETAHGEFFWEWSASNDKQRTITEDLKVEWPAHCTAETNALHCGDQGLQGRLSIDGVGRTYSAVMVKVFWFDGQSRVYTVTAAQPGVQLYGAADDQRGVGEIASAYLVLGVEHILSGVDHMLFVLGLLFLVGFQRKLVWTITAFTLAHSMTLASAALGLLTLRSPPVEATIALSIVLVAGEALHHRQTLARRWPVILAFLFGLVHGLGFAGALKDIGLPQNYLSIALLCFNVGVEIGQLMIVGAAWCVWRMAQRWPVAEKARAPILYVIGSVAAYWSWLRIVAIFS